MFEDGQEVDEGKKKHDTEVPIGPRVEDESKQSVTGPISTFLSKSHRHEGLFSHLSYYPDGEPRGIKTSLVFEKSKEFFFHSREVCFFREFVFSGILFFVQLPLQGSCLAPKSVRFGSPSAIIGVTFLKY